jgi:hypothetical protein
MTISRVWHGWTIPPTADAYEHLLRHEIFDGISRRGIPGFRGIDLLRRDAEDLVEFVTIMWFDSVDAVGHLPVRTSRSPSCRRQPVRCSRSSTPGRRITTCASAGAAEKEAEEKKH